jgi:hypothetical protein
MGVKTDVHIVVSQYVSGFCAVASWLLTGWSRGSVTFLKAFGWEQKLWKVTSIQTELESCAEHSVCYREYTVQWTQNNCELGKRHSKRGKKKERARGSAIVNSLSMYSITENIYYSQLSSVAILPQPELVFTSYSTRKDWVLYPNVLSPCGLTLTPTCLLITVNEARSYFASTIQFRTPGPTMLTAWPRAPPAMETSVRNWPADWLTGFAAVYIYIYIYIYIYVCMYVCMYVCKEVDLLPEIFHWSTVYTLVFKKYFL